MESNGLGPLGIPFFWSWVYYIVMRYTKDSLKIFNITNDSLKINYNLRYDKDKVVQLANLNIDWT